MINIGEKAIKEDELYEKMIPILINEVFHITSYKNYKKILKDGYIKASLYLKGEPTTSHSKGSYFYKKGYISLFDGRKGAKEITNHLRKYLSYAKLGNKYVILFLSKLLYKKIKKVNSVKVSKNGEMIIPNIEVGYEKEIPIYKIYKILTITIRKKKPKKGSLMALNETIKKLEKKGYIF